MQDPEITEAAAACDLLDLLYEAICKPPIDDRDAWPTGESFPEPEGDDQ